MYTFIHTLKTPRTWKGSHGARPISGSDWSGICVKLTWNQSQKCLSDSDSGSVWPGFLVGSDPKIGLASRDPFQVKSDPGVFRVYLSKTKSAMSAKSFVQYKAWLAHIHVHVRVCVCACTSWSPWLHHPCSNLNIHGMWLDIILLTVSEVGPALKISLGFRNSSACQRYYQGHCCMNNLAVNQINIKLPWIHNVGVPTLVLIMTITNKFHYSIGPWTVTNNSQESDYKLRPQVWLKEQGIWARFRKQHVHQVCFSPER